ncbi:aspartate kinase [Deferrisoma camini]|uniref:aspartate kinase n=1 Tax=Deferrisoma camini TaxID=1035120 RepID=UPI00046C8EAA|nr:aspartate kinase [Deferrisoma camini]
MALVVQKYGGTSVGDLDRIRNVARRVARYREEGHDVVVVVSAMAGTTDRLLQMAHDLAELPDERELDVLLATGEQVTIALLAITLNAMGVPAVSMTGFQCRVLTDASHTKARISQVETEGLRRALDQGKVVVVAGFQGVDPATGNITTLGRGGSDTSAVAVAAALGADACEIYTDVDGVYTTDPNVCERARKLKRISYDEMLELASVGAKVLQIRSVEFAKKFGVPIHVRSSFSDDEGTWVVEESEEMEQVVVAGVAYDRNEAKVSVRGVPDRPGIAAKIFGALAERNIVVDMIVQDVGEGDRASMTFTVPKADLKRALAVIEPVAEELGATHVEADTGIAKVSIVGVGMRSHAGVAAQMFEALSREGINVMMISTSEIKVSCVIEEKYTELAVRVLHSAFGLDRENGANA